MDLTDGELALCIAALEYAAGELREGNAASKRLNMPIPPMVMEMAKEMDTLRSKLLGEPQAKLNQ